VGTVWIGWKGKKISSGAECYQFSGSRSEIRESAADSVIKKLSKIIEEVLQSPNSSRRTSVY
jgi:nicotinamide mononucleotide (NMN) deamidase PncC